MESLLLREAWGERFKSIVGQSVHVTRPARALLRREHTRGKCCAWRDEFSSLETSWFYPYE